MFVILLTANFKFRNRSTCSKGPMKRDGKGCEDSQDMKSPGEADSCYYHSTGLWGQMKTSGIFDLRPPLKRIALVRIRLRLRRPYRTELNSFKFTFDVGSIQLWLRQRIRFSLKCNENLTSHSIHRLLPKYVSNAG